MGRIGSWAQGLPHYRTTYRQLHNLCIDFDLLQPAGVFSADEQALVRKVCADAAKKCMQRGDGFNPYDYLAHEEMRVSNTNTDRLAAVGMWCLTFPDHPQARAWLDHVVEEWTWQLENWLLADGFFPEGTRYHGAVLRQILPFAYALRRNHDVDLFAHPKMKRMFEALMALQTPPDATLGGISLIPGLADANWETVWSAVFGWAAGAYAQSDPALAGRLMWAWRRAGSPFTVEFSPGNPIIGLLCIGPEIQALPQPPLESAVTDMGYAILRANVDSDRESYFLLNATSIPNPGHQHADRGSFSLYALGTPLALDPGVADYAVTRGQWYARSRAHNMVTFGARESGRRVRIAHRFFDRQLDYLDIDLASVADRPYHRRVLFFRPYFYVLWDDFSNDDDLSNDKGADYHLHVLGSESGREQASVDDKVWADRIEFRCGNQANLDWMLISPATGGKSDITLQAAPHPVRFYAEHDSMPTMVREQTPNWLRVRQAGSSAGFLTVLHPYRDGDPPLILKDADANAGRLSIVQFERGDELHSVYIPNSATTTSELNGQLGVVSRSNPMGLESVYLIDGVRFAPNGRYLITADYPVTLVVRSLGGDDHFQLQRFGNGYQHVELHLPWKDDAAPIRVKAKGPSNALEDAIEIPVVRNESTGAITFTLDYEQYEITTGD